eukprot:gene11810-11954_t
MNQHDVADWEAAVLQLSTATVHKDSKAAEQLLLRFRSSEGAWTACLQAFRTANTPAEVLLFAAQTLKCKVNESGAGVPPVHLHQLLDELLVQLSVSSLPSQLVRQLCLTAAGLAALLPGWGSLIDAVKGKLPLPHAVELLQAIAEEGGSEWHHVILPGLTAGQRLEWATSTRERFRSWSEAVVPLVHSWLRQFGADTRVLVQLMGCLTAWVRLGCLHQVPAQVAESTAQAALLCLQSSNEQEVMAGLELLLELPEAAPESLLTALQPGMLDMAHAAQQCLVPHQQKAAQGNCLQKGVKETRQSPQGCRALQQEGVTDVIQDVLQMTCRVLGPLEYLSAAMSVWKQHPNCRARSASDLSQALPAKSATVTWDSECGAAITYLLSCAVDAMQQPEWSTNGLSQQQQQDFLVHFCTSVKVWSSLLVGHVTSAESTPGQDVAAMSGLLTVLLSIMTGVEAAAAGAAAAIRAVITAAVSVGWAQLHQVAPVVMQAVQTPGCVGSAEHDLLVSLSLCLAAPGAAAAQLHHLRWLAAQQVLQPSVDFMQQVLQQLKGGTAWGQLPASAEITLCHQLARVKAVLDGRLLLQQHLRSQLSDALDQPGGPPRHTCWKSEEQTAGADADADADALAEQLAAVAAMDEDQAAGSRLQETSRCTWERDEVDGRVSTAAWGSAGVVGNLSSLSQAAAVAGDPAMQLLLDQLWPQLHVSVLQYNASGRFLSQYGKCCSRLLRIHPGLLLSQLQPFLQVAVVGISRNATSTLAETFGQVVVLCSRPGSELLLENSALIIQAVNELWEQPKVAALSEPAAGDQQPDLAELVLRLTSTYVRHGRMFGPSSSALAAIEQAVAAASGCAACCHRKVASSALGLLNAVLDAANGSDAPQRQMLLEMVDRRGTHIAQAAFGALLAPSPLPRLHKASVVLLELAAAVYQVRNSNNNHHTVSDSVGPSAAAEKLGLPSLQATLIQAARACVPKIGEQEAIQVAVDCATLLSTGSGPQSRSYLVSRRLKKLLRDFAEMHMRSLACTSAMLKSVAAVDPNL